MKKVLLLCATSRSVRNFRMGLIDYLKRNGCEVVVCAFDNENEEIIKSSGAKYITINAQNRSINPFSFGKLKKQYISLIKEEKPDVILTFVLKPNVYGAFAAKKVGFENIYSFVEGTGDVFINNSIKWKLIRKYVCLQYKKAFKISKRVFFLNKDDRAEFLKRGLLLSEKSELIPGIGIDLNRFSFSPIENKDSFLMVSRLLKTKGVIEYCEAAKIVKEKYPNAVFNLVGPEGTLTASDLQPYIDNDIIKYHGATNDVRPYLGECGIYALPSYREGFSVSIMEAQATGRPVITCDTNGTRDSVDVGENGFLVKVGSSEELAEKMIYFLENPDKVIEMGKNARERAEKYYNQNEINKRICQITGVE